MKSKILKTLILLLTISMAFFAVSCKKNKHESTSESPSQSVKESIQSSESQSLSESVAQSVVESLSQSIEESESISLSESEPETEIESESDGEEESYISFNTLTVSGTDVYGKVANSQIDFSFVNEITIIGSADFIVSLDCYGTQTVITKTVPLNAGDNTFYVFETIDNKLSKTYVVTIRRRPIYTVTFNANGGSQVASQQVEEDYFATEPTTQRAGYDFAGWDYNFATPITNDITINASWRAHTNTKYKVEYYLQNLEDDNYTLDHVDELEDTTDTTATAEIKTFEHFTYNVSKSTASGNINGDESLVLKVYYTLDKHTVSVNVDGGRVTNAGNHKYGYSLSSTATVYLGYDFIGWYSGEELLSTDLTYEFTVEKSVVAKFEVWEELSNFNLTSTTTDCTITGIKDKTVTEIVVPDYVTGISGGAFSGCSNLQSITLPFVGGSKNATTASESTLFGYIFGTSSYTGSTKTLQRWSKGNSVNFYIPSSLTQVTITGGKILYGAFSSCSNLTSVVIPDSVTIIGDYMFSDCDSLTSVVIGDSVTTIGEGAFYNSDSLTSVAIGTSVTSIGCDAFTCCYKLVEVINNSTHITVTKGSEKNGHVGRYALSVFNAGDTYVNKFTNDNGYIVYTEGSKKILGGYSGTETDLVIPDYITEINQFAFIRCDSLTSVVIGDSVTTIGDYAFYYCSSLTSVVIGDSVTTIGDYAFRGCSSLTSVVIGDSVTTIGEGAFASCYSLTSVKYKGTAEEWSAIRKGSDWDYNTGNYTITYNYTGE